LNEVKKCTIMIINRLRDKFELKFNNLHLTVKVAGKAQGTQRKTK